MYAVYNQSGQQHSLEQTYRVIKNMPMIVFISTVACISFIVELCSEASSVIGNSRNTRSNLYIIDDSHYSFEHTLPLFFLY